MQLPSFLTLSIWTWAILGSLVARSSAYFVVNTPLANNAWINGAANLVSWTKGLLDGVPAFDLELARLSQDGLLLIAKSVPANSGGTLNIFLEDVPPANDYFLLFINSTHGLMYGLSPKFTILPADTTVPSNLTLTIPNKSVPTVTISGSPNPTQVFAATFAAATNGARAAWSRATPWSTQLLCFGLTFLGCFLGAAWTIW